MSDENPLDRITAGPPPTGPSPWRAGRLPTGSPYANGLYGTGEVPRRRGLGRGSWIALIVAIALLGGAVGWALLSAPADPAPGFAFPIGTSAARPTVPSVAQVTGSPVFTTALVSPPGCPLPPLATTREAVAAFATAGTACLESVWGLRAGTVRVFEAHDDVPGTGCFTDEAVTSFGTCGDDVQLNYPAAVAAAGNQAGKMLQWLAMATANRALTRAGAASDIDALVRSVGDTGGTAIDYRKRAQAQKLCLAGATMHRLLDHGITSADLAQASAASRTWVLLGGGPDGPRITHATAQSWFDRGSLSPTQEVCRTAWTVTVDRVA